MNYERKNTRFVNNFRLYISDESQISVIQSVIDVINAANPSNNLQFLKKTHHNFTLSGFSENGADFVSKKGIFWRTVKSVDWAGLVKNSCLDPSEIELIYTLECKKIHTAGIIDREFQKQEPQWKQLLLILQRLAYRYE